MTNENPRLFSYIVDWDGGLAPNPFWSWLTLAVCKPQIRKSAKENDLIVGLSSKRFDNQLIYAMVVSRVLTFGEYFQDSEFYTKIPDMNADDPCLHVGDNFYQPLESGQYKQLPSVHSNPNGTENIDHKARDLSGLFVLAASEFYYFGESALSLPSALNFLRVGRGQRVTTDTRRLNDFRRYLDKQEVGIHGMPKKLGEY